MPKNSPQPKIAAAPDLKSLATEAFFLHFYTHVNMTATASKALGTLGFSLTKNRILGFATLTPGITVGELVSALRVTHQNLNEPMRRLINEGYIVAKIGEEDRRQKRLFATNKGSRLYRRVLADQLNLFENVFDAVGPDAARTFIQVNRHFVEASDREWIDKAIIAASDR
jgi:DNA-binding MarR family transcriptional regulator